MLISKKSIRKTVLSFPHICVDNQGPMSEPSYSRSTVPPPNTPMGDLRRYIEDLHREVIL